MKADTSHNVLKTSMTEFGDLMDSHRGRGKKYSNIRISSALMDRTIIRLSDERQFNDGNQLMGW